MNLLTLQLVDTVTWLAMASVGLPEVESVTTNMSAEFAKPFGQLGDDLIIEGECVQQGESTWVGLWDGVGCPGKNGAAASSHRGAERVAVTGEAGETCSRPDHGMHATASWTTELDPQPLRSHLITRTSCPRNDAGYCA